MHEYRPKWNVYIVYMKHGLGRYSMLYINERFAADQRIPQKGMTKCTLGLIKLEGIPPV